MKSSSGPARFEIFIDGSSRGNPGESGCGIVIRDADGVVLLEEGYYLGKMTNNSAEYNALLIALEEALVLRAEAVNVYSDSELLVRQMNGQYRVKNAHLRGLYARAKRLADSFGDFEIKHINREQNNLADGLAQRASKTQKSS